MAANCHFSVFHNVEPDFSKMKRDIKNRSSNFFVTYSHVILSKYEALTPSGHRDYRVTRRLDVFGSKTIEILKDSLMK